LIRDDKKSINSFFDLPDYGLRKAIMHNVIALRDINSKKQLGVVGY